MAAPGIGAGDILTACKFVYDICVKYKDAPEQFDEIAEKAAATRKMIQRLNAEAMTGGSLVERAGLEAEEEFQGHLRGLRKDLEQLQKLVENYSTIHDNGPGRRLLWAVWESGNLTEYRRKISYHEQKLNFWYTTLVYGSLRRIENGQEQVINAINQLPNAQEKMIRDALAKKNDIGPLIRALEKHGISREQTGTNIGLATQYLSSNKKDRDFVTEHVHRRSCESRLSSEPRRTTTTGYGNQGRPVPKSQDEVHFTARPTASSRPSIFMPEFQDLPGQSPGSYVDLYPGINSYQPMDVRNVYQSRAQANNDFQPNKGASLRPHAPEHETGIRRSRSSRRPRSPRTRNESTEMKVEEEVGKTKVTFGDRPHETLRPQGLKPGHARRSSDTPLTYRSKNPLVILEDGRRDVHVPTAHLRTRSSSVADRQETYKGDIPVIVVEESELPERYRSRNRDDRGGSSQRGSSTEFYSRQRPRSSSGGSVRSVTHYRVVKKMDRIDSLPVDETSSK